MNREYCFLFFNKAQGKYTKLAFSKKFVHCCLLTFEPELNIVIKHSLYKEGLKHVCMSCTDFPDFISKLQLLPNCSAYCHVNIFEFRNYAQFPIKIYSCNEIIKMISGINIGFTFNPKHLWNKLVKHHNPDYYQIISSWERDTVINA